VAARLSHPEIEEMLGVYALDAVDQDEAEQIELHLRDCPRCADEVASHREVAASMAHEGAHAPEGVWDRIAGSLEEPPPQLDMARVTALGPRRRSLPLGPVAAFAASAAVLIAALGVQVVRQEQRIDRLPDIVEKRGLDEAVAEIGRAHV
jgi:anti-sigma factor RsiW